jgi:hypothetical protein
MYVPEDEMLVQLINENGTMLYEFRKANPRAARL